MKCYLFIYVDLVWFYGNMISNGVVVDYYFIMSLFDMKWFLVWEFVVDNVVLVMWYIGIYNQEVIELVEVWGFMVCMMKGFIWVKLNQLVELCIIKVLVEGDVIDFYDFFVLLNVEMCMNGGNYICVNIEDVLIVICGVGLECKYVGIKQVVYSLFGVYSEKLWEVCY